MDNPRPTDTAFCLACGYSLKNLPANRCPECGRAFDPADPRTMSMGRPLRGWQRRLLKPIGWPTIILAVLGTGGLVYLGHRPHLFSPEPWSVMTDEYNWPQDDLFPMAPRDKMFYRSIACWIACILLGFMWQLGLRLVPKNARRASLTNRFPPLRMTVLTLAVVVSVFSSVFCWQQRLGRRWFNRLQTQRLGFEGAPLSHLSHDDARTVVDDVIRDMPNRWDQFQSISFLINGTSDDAVRRLLHRLESETDPELIVWELRLIALARDPSTAPILIRRLKDPNPDIRAAAADAVGILRQPTYPFRVPKSDWRDVSLYLAPRQSGDNGAVRASDVYFADSGNWDTTLESETPIAVDESIRPILQHMMTEGPTQPEREAAAHTLLNWPPADYQLRLAEWGVWIENGNNLELPQLPPMLHRPETGAGVLPAGDSDLSIPVIMRAVVHLTSNVAIASDINAHIRKGWPALVYPLLNDYGITSSLRFGLNTFPIGISSGPLKSVYNATAPFEPRSNTDPLAYTSRDYPWLFTSGWGRYPTVHDPAESPANWSPGLQWTSLIVSPTLSPVSKPADLAADPKLRWWTEMRNVPSSWITSRGETERFLYYDGPTLSLIPVAVPRNKSMRDFHITESPAMPIEAPPPGLIESPSDSKLADREGFYVEISSGEIIGEYVHVDSAGLVELPANLPLQGPALIQRFRQMLLDYGLSAPEAEGLIATWTPQFFQTEGRRFILRMSPADYDRQCPMQVRPKPTEIVRLGLVLTEFDQQK